MNSSNTYQCGTKACRARHHFRRPLARYKRPPKGTVERAGEFVCARCGKGKLNPCGAAIRRWNRRQFRCECGFIPYPHREGSADRNHGLCAHHPEFEL